VEEYDPSTQIPPLRKELFILKAIKLIAPFSLNGTKNKLAA